MTSNKTFGFVAKAIGFLGALAVSLGIANAARAQVITVTTGIDGVSPGGACSLREAIATANGDTSFTECGTGSTIVFSPTVTVVTLTLSGSANVNPLAGDLDISRTVLISGGVSGVVITTSASFGDRIFDIVAAVPVTFVNLTLRGGVAPTVDDDPNVVCLSGGGGIRATLASATVHLKGVNFQNNSAQGAGGGVCARSATVSIADGLFTRNSAQNGGGIYASGSTVLLTATQVVSNQASQNGGGIYALNSAARLTATQVVSNQAANGGGIYALNSTALVTATQVVSNQAANGGGTYALNSTVLLTATQVISNWATNNGGGLYLSSSSTAALAESRLSANTASAAGGGLYAVNSAAQFTATQVTSNKADIGGGLCISSSTALLSATQVLSNQAAQSGGGLHVDAASTVVIEDSQLAANGGVLLLSGGGLSVLGSTVHLSATQVAGNIGGFGGGLYVIEGAALLSATRVVSNQASVGGGLHVDNSTLRLTATRVAGNQASSNGGGLSIVNNSTALLTATQVVSNGQASSGVGLHVANSTVSLLDSEIAGNATTSLGTGGGLGAFASTVQMTGTRVVNNRSGIGGGLYLLGGTLRLDTAQVVSNQAFLRGGGLFLALNANALLSASQVLSNHAPQDGGGLYILNNTTAVLMSTQVLSNRVNGNGGGVYVSNNSAVLLTTTHVVSNQASSGGGIHADVNSVVSGAGVTVAQNTAAAQGGGVFLQSGVLTLTESLVQDNRANNGAGGGFVVNATALLSNTRVISNQASQNGGGLAINGTLVVTSSSVISGNQAASGGGITNTGITRIEGGSQVLANRAINGDGGGIANVGLVSIRDAQIVSNSALLANTNGGGIASSGAVEIRSSLLQSNTAANEGGGIWMTGTTTLLIADSALIGNEGGPGGAVLVRNGVLFTMTNSSVEGNRTTVGRSGAGVVADFNARADISSTQIRNNLADLYAGGVLVRRGSILTLTNSTVAGNIAGAGGGGIATVPFGGGAVRLYYTTVSGNQALSQTAGVLGPQGNIGGGILGWGDSANQSFLTILSSTITNNVGFVGGGIATLENVRSRVEGGAVLSNTNAGLSYNSAGPNLVINSTVGENEAGVSVITGTAYLTHTTIASNGGIGLRNISGTVNVSATLLAYNAQNCSGVLAASGVNLSSDATCPTFSITNANPLLQPLALNGGATLNYVPVLGGPAHNVTSCARPVDQRGVARPQGAACEVGSIELKEPVSLTLVALPATTAVSTTAGSTLTATVLDALNNPVPGAIVNFTTTLGTLSALSGTSNANGQVVVALSSTVLGVATVKATVGVLSATTQVTFTPGPPAVITLTAVPPTTAVSTTAGSTLLVTATDALGNLVQPTAVVFSTSFGTLAPTSTTTLNGVATATLTSTVVGVATVQVNVGGLTATVQVTFTTGPASIVSLVLSPTLIFANGVSQSIALATVLDPFGNPVNGATVQFLAFAGQFSPLSATTNISGQATAVLTSLVPMIENVLAIVAGGGFASAQVTYANLPASQAPLTGTLGAVTQSLGAVRKGDLITYTLVLTNQGPGQVTGIQIVAPIPSGTTYVPGSAQGGNYSGNLIVLAVSEGAEPSTEGTLDPQATLNAVTWAGALSPGSAHTLTFAVQVQILEGLIVHQPQVFVDNILTGINLSSVVNVTALKTYVPIVRRD